MPRGKPFTSETAHAGGSRPIGALKGGRRAALLRGRKRIAALTDYERTRLRIVARGVVGAVVRGEVSRAERLITDYFTSAAPQRDGVSPEAASADATKNDDQGGAAGPRG